MSRRTTSPRRLLHAWTRWRSAYCEPSERPSVRYKNAAALSAAGRSVLFYGNDVDTLLVPGALDVEDVCRDTLAPIDEDWGRDVAMQVGAAAPRSRARR